MVKTTGIKNQYKYSKTQFLSYPTNIKQLPKSTPQQDIRLAKPECHNAQLVYQNQSVNRTNYEANQTQLANNKQKNIQHSLKLNSAMRRHQQIKRYWIKTHNCNIGFLIQLFSFLTLTCSNEHFRLTGRLFIFITYTLNQA